MTTDFRPRSKLAPANNRVWLNFTSVLGLKDSIHCALHSSVISHWCMLTFYKSDIFQRVNHWDRVWIVKNVIQKIDTNKTFPGNVRFIWGGIKLFRVKGTVEVCNRCGKSSISFEWGCPRMSSFHWSGFFWSRNNFRGITITRLTSWHLSWSLSKPASGSL